MYLMKIHISFVCLKQSDMYLMKIQINFYVLKKARLKNLDQREITKKSSKNMFKEKNLNKIWQLYQESEIIKHASSTKLIEKTRRRKEIDYLLHERALFYE